MRSCVIVTPDRLPYIVREALAVAFGFGAPVPSGVRTAEWVDFLFSALRFQAVRIDVPGSASSSLCRDCQPSRRSCCVSGFCRANTVQGRKLRFAPTASVKNNCSEAAVCRARCFSAGAGTALFRAVRGAFQVSVAIAPFRNQRACLWRIAPIKNSRSEAAVAGCGTCRRVSDYRPIVRPGYTLSASSRHLAAASRSWRLIT